MCTTRAVLRESRMHENNSGSEMSLIAFRRVQEMDYDPLSSLETINPGCTVVAMIASSGYIESSPSQDMVKVNQSIDLVDE